MDEAERDSDTVRRALALAVQILEELPDQLRPESNIEDMRDLSGGETTGRDGFIMAEALATALAFRAFTAMTTKTPNDTDAMVASINNREREFASLFTLVRNVNPELLAMLFTQRAGELPIRRPKRRACVGRRRSAAVSGHCGSADDRQRAPQIS